MCVLESLLDAWGRCVSGAGSRALETLKGPDEYRVWICSLLLCKQSGEVWRACQCFLRLSEGWLGGRAGERNYP